MTHHLTETEIVLFLRGRLSKKEHVRIVRHLADCGQCSESIAALGTLDRPMDRTGAPDLPTPILERAAALGKPGPESPMRRHRIRTIGWITAAAAIIAAVILIGPRNDEVPERFRSADPLNPAFHLTPDDASRVTVVSPTLSWSAVPSATGYRCVILHSTGVELMRYTGTDTTLTLSSPDQLEPGKEYIWRVEALLPDSRILRSELHTFRYDPAGSQ